MPRTKDPTSNQLLAALPSVTLARWRYQLELVELPHGRVLYEAGSPPGHAYFPCDGIVSLLCVTEDGRSAEIAMVGNEGVVGIALILGGVTRPNSAVVESAGFGYRLDASVIQAELHGSTAVMHLLLRFTQALLTQTSQIIVCTRHHTVEKQLCRWLLMILDRLEGKEMTMTQELIANMLGVRRESVTEGALKLQRAGLISYERGQITVLDRPGLELRSCECYAVVKTEYDRLSPFGGLVEG